ncbi:MAG: RimK family protein [Desulfobulbaceae bacterium]|nr:RimK family protein [Desulfobulbaceae bacterium]
MVEHLIIIDKPQDWSLDLPGAKLITPEMYLTDETYAKLPKARVLNLSRDYSYLSAGYYCSLLAEARRHRVLPTVKSLQDLSRKSIYQTLLEDITPAIGNTMDDPSLTEFSVESYFGHTTSKTFADLARRVFSRLPFPALSIQFKRKGNIWVLDRLKSLDIEKLSEHQAWMLWDGLRNYLTKRWRTPKAKPQELYDLAILVDPEEKLPPSDPDAIKLFISAAKRADIDAEVISKKDLHRLAEYDALFIRETTYIDHYTYRFARKAQADGMVVIDDPDTILRCANKVYLAELLKAHRIDTPQTTILTRHNATKLLPALALPLVLKIPDGSFSRGVKKAATLEEAKSLAREMLKESDLILAQEFVYTDFDWRVGIIDRKPLFVCQYFMSKAHWQIIDHAGSGEWGKMATLPLEDVPPKVVETALKAANLIGDGLFGVDVKQLGDGRVIVIEVNDNPNIESEAEDLVLRDKLYDTVMESFRRRLDSQMQKKS